MHGKITSAKLQDERYKNFTSRFVYLFFYKPNRIVVKTNKIKTKSHTLQDSTFTGQNLLNLPCQNKQENRNSEVSRGHVDPDVEREWRQKREQVWRFLHRLLVQNAHS
jgi:hypothetical protein